MKMNEEWEEELKNADWKVVCLMRLLSALGDLDQSESNVEIEEGPLSDWDPFEDPAMIRVFEMMFPSVDLDEMEDGITAAQLGAFLGQQSAAFTQFDSIFGSMEGALKKVEAEAMRFQRIGIEPERRKKASQVVSSLKDVVNTTESIVGVAPALNEAISECLRDAMSQPNEEKQAFFSAFAKTVSKPTIGPKGELLKYDPKAAPLYALIAAMGPTIFEIAGSVPELQRVLSRLVADEILTSDEDSERWTKEDRKRLEWVCKKADVRFRRRGKPPSKK